MSCEIGWLSKNSLIRYRPGLLYIHYAFFLFGGFFWIDATLGQDGFQADTWGSFAYMFPAKLWAALNMGASAIAIIGLTKPIRSWMVAVGAFLHFIQFAAITYSAIFTNGEMIVGLLSSVLFLPMYMWLFYESFTRWKSFHSSNLCRQ